MRISVFVIEVVRTLDELYNVRCSVRTVLVRSRNTTPTPEEILPLRLKNKIENTSSRNKSFVNNNSSHWEFVCKVQIFFSLREKDSFFAGYKNRQLFTIVDLFK